MEAVGGFEAREPAEVHGRRLSGGRGQAHGELPGPQRADAIGLVRILAAQRAAADRHLRSVVVDDELLAGQSVVAVGSAAA